MDVHGNTYKYVFVVMKTFSVKSSFMSEILKVVNNIAKRLPGCHLYYQVYFGNIVFNELLRLTEKDVHHSLLEQFFRFWTMHDILLLNTGCALRCSEVIILSDVH